MCWWLPCACFSISSSTRLLDVWIVIKPYLVQQGRRVRVSNQTQPSFFCTLAPSTVQSLEDHTQFWYSTNVIDGFLFHTSGSDLLDLCTRTCTCMQPAGVNPSGHTWDSPLAVKIYGYNIFSVFCALTAYFALCALCYGNLQACPWMHRLIWILFTQIQERRTEELVNAKMMSFGKAHQIEAVLYCTDVNKRESWIMKLGLKLSVGGIKRTLYLGNQFEPFFFSISHWVHTSESIHMKSWWEADWGFGHPPYLLFCSSPRPALSAQRGV